MRLAVRGQDNALHLGQIWGGEKRPFQFLHNPPTRRVARARATTWVASSRTRNANLFFARAGGCRSHHHDTQPPSPSVVRMHVAPHDPVSSEDDRPSGHSCPQLGGSATRALEPRRRSTHVGGYSAQQRRARIGWENVAHTQ